MSADSTIAVFTERSSTPAKTRATSTIFGLGSAITHDDSQITGSRLPTARQVLRCLMYHLQEGAVRPACNITKWESAKIVLTQVYVFYGKANIPMISERKACEKIIKLLDDNAKIRSIPFERRSTPATMSRLQEMEIKLGETFQLWPSNAEQLMKNAEDLAFLQSMKSDRMATFGTQDKVLAAKIGRRQARVKSEADRREKAQKEMAEQAESYAVITNPDVDCDSESEIATDSSVSSPRSHHRTVRTGTTAFIPYNIIGRPKLVALAARMKMTPAQQSAYTEALISEAGGESSKVSTSYSTADRSRRLVAQEIATTCKKQWICPTLTTLHWDSKMISSLSNPNVLEERLTVIVGDAKELKLLGVPSYQPGTDRKSGDIIAEKTTNLLNEWDCKDSVVNMTFDTTASNTGHVSAACVIIQQQLERALLWSGCRHHIGEVLLTHVFNDLKIEVSKSPDVTLFTRFRKNFDSLPHDVDQPLAHLDLSSFTGSAQILLEDCRATVLQLAKSELQLRRDDYLEFIKLCIMFLDDAQFAPSSSRTQATIFQRPGALHKARWMTKLLYSIKICLLEKQIQLLPPGTITTHVQAPKVRDFVIFATLVYSQWWMTCSSAVDAPWNDLKLLHLLLQYKEVNLCVSKSAVLAFQRHLWYLTEEMVPLALFSSKVPIDERRALADSLLAVKPDSELLRPGHRFGTGYGKPQFPSNVNLSTTLANLVGLDSWFFFHALHLDAEFLTEDVANWPVSPSYQAAVVNIQAINVVNDCAERGVKLSIDFAASAKNEKHYQNVLQVVEEDRKQQPNLRKRSANQSIDDM